METQEFVFFSYDPANQAIQIVEDVIFEGEP